jgi:hypothetical protein
VPGTIGPSGEGILFSAGRITAQAPQSNAVIINRAQNLRYTGSVISFSP